MLLVDEWISEHPVRTTLLSPGKVRFAAAKILLWQSGKATSAWPGEGAAQLVGILLCLLAFEGLSDHQAPVALPSTVLGLSCADILDLAREAVQRKGLTREEIVEAVSEMDTNGDMTQLATSVELAEALFRVGDGDTEPIAESAHWVPDLIAVGLGRAAPMLERAVRLRLARPLPDRAAAAGAAGAGLVPLRGVHSIPHGAAPASLDSDVDLRHLPRPGHHHHGRLIPKQPRFTRRAEVCPARSGPLRALRMHGLLDFLLWAGRGADPCECGLPACACGDLPRYHLQLV